MPQFWVGWVVLLAAAIVVGIILNGRARKQRLLSKLRSQWGRARDRERDMEIVAAYHRELPAEGFALDDDTWDDLDLDQVFATLDRNESLVGQQALYHRLRTIPPRDRQAAFESLVEWMSSDRDARERAQIALRALGEADGYELWWLTTQDELDRQSWQVLYPVLAAGIFGLLCLSILWPGLLVLVIVVFFANVVIRGTSLNRVGWLLLPFRQVSALLGVASALPFLVNDETGPILGPLAGELPGLGRLRKLSRWIGRDPMSTAEVTGIVMEYLNILFLLDLNALYFAGRELRRRASSMRAVIAAVGEADTAISIASFRTGLTSWTRPTFVPAGARARLLDLRHPLLADAVPNSIELGPPHGVLVTGSNMSGKTTFLRTVGVNAVLAQSIHTCLASLYEAPILHVESLIGRQDDLAAGKSYYLAEVEGVVSRLDDSASRVPHLFLFDELFRGTNAVERIAAAEAVLTEMVVDHDGRPKPHFVLVAVHDLELVELLGHSYTTFHFADSLDPEGLRFDYHLRPGPTSSRNAIALLAQCGASDSLVARAEARATVLDRTRSGELVEGSREES